MKIKNLSILNAAVGFLTICGFSAPAQAAKVFTVSGTITPDQYGDGIYQFQSNAMSNGFRFTWGLTAKFSQPSSGLIDVNGDCSSCWYLYNQRTHQYTDTNEGGATMGLGFTNAVFAKGTQRYQPTFLSPTPTMGRAWYIGQDGRNPLITLSLSNMTSPTQFTLSGFSAAPEPATWALLILGFGSVGMAMRRKVKPRSSLSSI